ncbi:MAG: DUF86 domain-containing protein [Candidatus Aminicenantes bacterium]|nr:DUF86 domain-containing protein [Candidatus Aminicenantes bacterium]
MFNHRDRDYLGDIREAILRILDYSKDQDYRSYLKDKKTQDAILRNLEVIGEAAKKISSKMKSENVKIPWRNMAGLRDKLIHHYFGVKHEVIWEVKKELPKILDLINDMLKKIPKINNSFRAK